MLLVQAIGHQVVYLLGARVAAHADRLPHEPHEAYWAWAVLGVLGGVAAVLGALLVRSRRLRHRLVELAQLGARTPSATHPEGALELARLARMWLAVFGVSLALFVVQENADHVLAEGRLAGVAVLYERAYALGLPVFAGVSLVASIIAVALHRGVEQLEKAVRLAERWLAQRRVSGRTRSPVASRPTSTSRAGTPGLGRAPPLPA